MRGGRRGAPGAGKPRAGRVGRGRQGGRGKRRGGPLRPAAPGADLLAHRPLHTHIAAHGTWRFPAPGAPSGPPVGGARGRGVAQEGRRRASSPRLERAREPLSLGRTGASPPAPPSLQSLQPQMREGGSRAPGTRPVPIPTLPPKDCSPPPRLSGQRGGFRGLDLAAPTPAARGLHAARHGKRGGGRGRQAKPTSRQCQLGN